MLQQTIPEFRKTGCSAILPTHEKPTWHGVHYLPFIFSEHAQEFNFGTFIVTVTIFTMQLVHPDSNICPLGSVTKGHMADATTKTLYMII